MAKAKCSSMQDFLVTFFVENRMVSRMLSEVLKNRNDRLFLETLGLPADVVIPFSQDNDVTSVVYMLKQRLNSSYDVTLNGKPCGDDVIHSGDYFTFRNRSSNQTVRMLFIATSDIQVGYKKYKLSKDTNYFIGRTPLNDISYSFSDYIAREKHAAIRIDGSGNAFIEDLKRSVGVYVNGRLVHSQQLKPFDEIFIMGLSMVYMGGFIAVRNLKTDCAMPTVTSFEAKTPVDDSKEKEYFVSTPRILKSLDHVEVEVDAPPSPFTADKTPAILTLGPSLTMSMVMLASLGVSIANAISGSALSTVIASGVMAVGMLLGSLLWPSLLRSYQKRRIVAEEKHRKEKYGAYIDSIEKDLTAQKERTIRILNDSLCPSPEVLCSMLDSESNKLRLWERSCEDDDFLSVRMGLGDRSFDVQLKTPRQGFQLYDDELRDRPAELAKEFSVLSNVPLTLDIRNNHTIGIIGNRKIFRPF